MSLPEDCDEEYDHISPRLKRDEQRFSYDLFENQRIRLEAEINDRIFFIQKAIDEKSDFNNVKFNLEYLNRAFYSITLVYEKILSLLNDTSAHEDWFSHFDQTVFLCKTSAIRYIDENEGKFEISLRKSSTSKSSRSSSSKSSSKSPRSSSSSASRVSIVDLEAELAELEVEVEFADKKGLSLDQKTRLEEKVAKKRAKLNVYRAHIDKGDNSLKSEACSEFSVDSLNQIDSSVKGHSVTFNENSVNINSSVPKNTLSSLSRFKSNAQSTDFIDGASALESFKGDVVQNGSKNSRKYIQSTTPLPDLRELLLLQSAPNVHLEKFKGDPLKFKLFMTNFEELVEKRVFDSSGRLARLLDYTEGEANNLIQGCVFRVNDGYEHAKNLLKRRFGDPHRVMNFYRKALENYNVIKPGDSASFENFYSFLLRCGSLIEEHLWNGFDSVDNLCLIVSKLPLYSRDKWNRLVLSLRKREFREPCFKDILNFVEEEMMVANDPLFSREALQERFPSKTSSRDKPTNPSFRKPVSTFATCFSCKADHDLELCPHYSKLPLKDKTRWLLKQRLYFGYLGRGHISSDCKNKRICNVCKNKHPTSLHGFVPSKIPPSSPTDSQSTENETSSPENTDSNPQTVTCSVNKQKN